MYYAQPGSKVRIHYSTRTGAGSLVETSANREPFEFTVGDPRVIQGINQALIGMVPGERKQVRIPPEFAFGFRDQRWQQTAPAVGLPERLMEGDQLHANIQGQLLDVWVRTASSNELVLDANHPLAGETLTIDIELESLLPPPAVANELYPTSV